MDKGNTQSDAWEALERDSVVDSPEQHKDATTTENSSGIKRK